VMDAGQSDAVGGVAMEPRTGHVRLTTVNVVTYPEHADDFPAPSVRISLRVTCSSQEPDIPGTELP
jgi:hypothetical protein